MRPVTAPKPTPLTSMTASLWLALLACAPGSYELQIHVVDEAGASLSNAWVDLNGEAYEVDNDGFVELQDLDAPALRMGAMDVPVPFSPALEDLTVPTPEAVAEQARKLCAGEMIHAA